MSRLADLEAMIRTVRAETAANRPLSGPGIDFIDAQGGQGRVGQVRAVSGATVTAKLHPLEVLISEAGVSVRIVYGLVDGFADPFSPGDDPPYILAASGSDKIIAGVTMAYDSASGNWQSTACYFISDASVPAADATNAYYEIGSVNSDVTIAVSAVSGSIAHRRCGDGTTYSDQWWLAP